MGIPAVYGWLGVIAAIIGFSLWMYYRIRKSASVEAQLEKEVRDRLEAERRAKESEQAREVERRPLPLGCAGPKLRDVPSKLGGQTPNSRCP